MKRKVFSVLFALVLVCSLGLVMAVPAAADVSPATVDVDPPLVDVAAEYTIVFDITTILPTGGWVYIEFPSDTTVPDSYSTGDITIQGVDVTAGNVSQSATLDVKIVLAAPIVAPGTVTVVFTTDAGIVNPTSAGTTYKVIVNTSAEGEAINSEEYTILALPAVTEVQPEVGNVGDTMWVEVFDSNSNFVGDSDTNVSDTELDFGGGITVNFTKYVGPGEIDVEITITAPGQVSVAATTAAGTGTGTHTFTANPAGTPQVDVWDTYTPVADLAVGGTWDAATLAMTGDNVEATIADAITASSGDETLIVHADTYEENISINQSITLQSLSGADSTIIDGGSGSVVDVTAIDVTVDGFTIKGDGTTAAQRGLDLHKTGFTIKNNKVIDVADHNIWMKPTDTIDSGTIDTNTFTGLGSNAEGAGIWVEADGFAISGVEITDNTISDFDRRHDGGMSAIELEDSTSGVDSITMSGNTISDSFSGIRINGSAGDGGALEITDNIISGCNSYDVSAGVTVGSGNPILNLTNNTITGNVFGIELFNSDGTYIIKYNDITGNSEWGLFHSSGADITITAQYNWWGAIGGPSSGIGSVYGTTQGSPALGSGDAMCKDVDSYEPWLTRSQATAIEDGIAYHGSTYPLQAGWNTLSVPLALDDDADTLNDIVALGDFIISDPEDLNKNYLGGYYYDADAANGLWVELPGAYQFAPCKAVYVKMAEDASFPVLYSGVFDVPSVSLPTGWNLIGSGFGVDKTLPTAWVANTAYALGDEVVPITLNGFKYVCTTAGTSHADTEPTWPTTVGDTVVDNQVTWTTVYGEVDYGIAATIGDSDGEKIVKDALASLGANASVVISPSLPGQTAPWGTVATDPSTKMIVGEGYWVFMTAAATLAGFEVTPIYWINLP